MIRIVLFILVFFSSSPLSAQDFALQLSQNYELYKEQSIQNRRFKHKDIRQLIQQLPADFEVQKAGTSFEGRAIYLIKIGTGKTKIFLWSQMHGNEPTATMALMDIFNFFKENDQLDLWRKDILSNVTLYFIPMLNPDGADVFQRRTALNIDLNRDALRLQTPEGQLLKRIRDELNPEWGFNLHDQSRYYSVGATDKTATVSFLAPAFNYEKDINEIRGRAMQQIGLMNATLQKFIPGHVAKYNDSFEPRAFGDNIQKWGTSTILIEAGGYKNDREKQFIRKLNFIALLTAFEQIANKTYKNNSYEGYESIPFNGRYFHELLVRNASFVKNGITQKMDIGFRSNEVQFNEYRDFYIQSYIADLGDLSTYHGYKSLDAAGYTIVPGKIYPKTIKKRKKLRKLKAKKLHEKGFTDVPIKNITNIDMQSKLPLRFISAKSAVNTQFDVGGNPSFFLQKNGKNEYLIINGQLHKLGTIKNNSVF